MFNNIIKGIQSYTGSFRLISKLKLWKYFFIPMLISLITAALVTVIAYSLSDNIGNFIANIWGWEWGKETFTSISSFIGGIIIFAIGLILYKHIVMALSAPFMSPVSEKIEAHFSGKNNKQYRNTNFQQQLIRGIRISARNLIKELLLTIPILLLKFIPGVNIFSTALLFLLQSYYAGFGNMDYTLERHFAYKDSVRFVRKHKGIAIGNGIIFILCLLIPVLGVIIVLPLSVTAASKNTIELLQKDQNLQLNEG